MTDKRTTRMYNPLLNKKPYGASVQNQETRITFPVDNSLQIKRVLSYCDKFSEREERLQAIPCDMNCPILTATKRKTFCRSVFAFRVGYLVLSLWGRVRKRWPCVFGRGLDGIAVRGDWLPEWQLTVTKCDYKTPNWAKQGVTYQIFADRFCKVGDKPFTKKAGCTAVGTSVPTSQRTAKIIARTTFRRQYQRYYFKTGLFAIPRCEPDLPFAYFRVLLESSLRHRRLSKIDPLFGTEEEFSNLIEKASEKA